MIEQTYTIEQMLKVIDAACKNLIEYKERSSEEFAEAMKQIIINTAKHLFSVEEDQIKFKQDPNDDKIAIIPANLYTLLLMRGIVLPFSYVEKHKRINDNEEVELDIPANIPYYSGHTMVFKPDSANHYLRLNKALQYIKLDVTLNSTSLRAD